MSEQRKCPQCGRPEWKWTANQGLGYPDDEMLYCCAGCAQGTGCTCHLEDRSMSQEHPSRRSSFDPFTVT